MGIFRRNGFYTVQTVFSIFCISKPTPYRKLCSFLLSQKKTHSVLFINLLKNGDMGKCPHKSPSPCNTCHTHVFIQNCVLICHKNTHTQTRARVHSLTLACTHTHTHARARTHSHTHTHTHTHTVTHTHTHTHTQSDICISRCRRSWISRSQTLQSELSQRVKVNLYFKSAVYCLLRTKSVVSVTSVQLANSVTDRNQKVSDDVLLLHSSMSL